MNHDDPFAPDFVLTIGRGVDSQYGSLLHTQPVDVSKIS